MRLLHDKLLAAMAKCCPHNKYFFLLVKTEAIKNARKTKFDLKITEKFVEKQKNYNVTILYSHLSSN